MFIMASGGDERMIDWIMYAKIQDLKRQKYKKARVAKKLRINRETVTKYWDMTPEEYEAVCNKHRERKPDRYKSQIVGWLKDFPDMTAAQIGPMSRLWTQKVELFSPYLIARRDVSYAARASSSTCCGVL